ncbi:S8 family peptidase [Leptothrix sp. BB-3]
MNKTSPYSGHPRHGGRWKAVVFALSMLALGHAEAVQRGGPTANPASPQATSQASLQAEGGLSDRLIIKMRDGAAAAVPDPSSRVGVNVASNRAGIRMSRLRGMAGNGAHVMKLDRRLDMASLQKLADEIKASDSAIEYVEPDRLMQPQWLPNDPMLAQQWNLTEAVAGLNLTSAWDLGTGAGVVVAVIDTGVRPHADLVANLLPGYDFISSTAISNDGDGRDADASDPGDWNAAGDCGTGSTPSPSSWHGTHVAGTIAAVANNGIGVAGVAPGARILPLRVIGRCGGYTSDIADAIVWAVGGAVPGLPVNPNPAKVLNLSLGMARSCELVTLGAIGVARLKGAVVVVSAGNSAADVSGFSPAGCPGVISVAAVDRKGARAWYSNYGASVAVAAPGGDSVEEILSTWNLGAAGPAADGYHAYSGTSMAAPHVAGVVALMLGRNPTLNSVEVEQLLKTSAAARGFPVACSQCGAGIVDARRAIEAAGGTATPPAPGVTAVAEVESNDTMAKAQTLTALPVQVNGTIASWTDVDHYRVVVPSGKTLTASLTSNGASDYDLLAVDTGGFRLAQSILGKGKVDTVRLSNTSANPKTMVLRVYRFIGLTGSAGTYSLVVSQD